MKLDIVVFGLSITSSWGNGHATTYRALIKALQKRGHRITFLEHDVAWYRAHRDLPDPAYCRTHLYNSLNIVASGYSDLVRDADLVIMGSYVPQGAVLADWITTHANGVTAFYDIDTPVTLAALKSGCAEYISPPLIPRFDLYLSFTGGPILDLIASSYGSPRVRPLYCSVDPENHRPVETPRKWRLGYLGTYSEDRQARLWELLVEPARALPDEGFVVAGASYPNGVNWPRNIELIEHVAPDVHSEFYCRQAYTLNVTRANMVQCGFSPSVRLFEAAACGVPIISDRWPGLDSIFVPGEEILIADSCKDVFRILRELPEGERLSIGRAGRQRVLLEHTADVRARQLESYYQEAMASRTRGADNQSLARGSKIGAVA
jgi:spore maturation protein CgeB